MSSKIVISLLICLSVQQAALAEDHVTVDNKAVSTTVRVTPRVGTVSRTVTRAITDRKGTNPDGTRSSVRSREDVRQNRSAHAHVRFDHAINRMSTFRDVHSSTEHTKMSKITTTEEHTAFQNLVVTAGHEEHRKEDHKHDEKRDKELKREEHKKGFFHHFRHHKGDGGGDELNVQQGGNQGIGDGSNVSASANSTISAIKDETVNMTLHQGTAFVAHNKPVSVKTDRGEVRIAPHSAVYIVSFGKSVAIYDIADHKLNDVKVITPGNKKLYVKAGEQLLLADKEEKDFEKANPVPEIKTSRMKDLGTDTESKIFHSEFSPIAALDHAKGFHDLVNSSSKSDKALADHILKMAAIVMNLRASDASP